ncbi:MAG: hypothetical protein Q4A05_01710 [Ruminococcus sp.]|nr:hypothetical protein [Ruminococcus sp.]
MNWIKNECFIRYESGKAVVVASIGMDTSADLPEVNDFEGRLLAMGSTAHDINTGDYYCLNSSGVWKKQKTAGDGGGLGTTHYTIQTAATRAMAVVGDLTVTEEE